MKKLNSKKIKKHLKEALKYFPAFFSSYLWAIFTIVSFVILAMGFLVFYKNAYGLKDSEYEPFVSVKEVDEKRMDRVLKFIEEENNISVTIPSKDPFVR